MVLMRQIFLSFKYFIKAGYQWKMCDNNRKMQIHQCFAPIFQYSSILVRADNPFVYSNHSGVETSEHISKTLQFLKIAEIVRISLVQVCTAWTSNSFFWKMAGGKSVLSI